MKKKKKVIKRRIKWKAIFKIFLLFICIASMFFFLFQIKTKRIIIKGNEFVSDNDIIVASGFKNYPYLFRISNETIKNNITSLKEVKEVIIHKSITGTLTLEIEENKPLFYNRNNNKLILSDGSSIESKQLFGVPTLINYVPDSFYERLIEKFKKINPDVIRLISEIEYQPWKNNDVMIDDTRFFLRMNDGNSVYVNIINLEKLNNYIEIFASLEDKKGTLYLDSSSDKISFSLY